MTASTRFWTASSHTNQSVCHTHIGQASPARCRTISTAPAMTIHTPDQQQWTSFRPDVVEIFAIFLSCSSQACEKSPRASHAQVYHLDVRKKAALLHSGCPHNLRNSTASRPLATPAHITLVAQVPACSMPWPVVVVEPDELLSSTAQASRVFRKCA